jgi:hypothetical protein
MSTSETQRKAHNNYDLLGYKRQHSTQRQSHLHDRFLESPTLYVATTVVAFSLYFLDSRYNLVSYFQNLTASFSVASE